MRMNVHNLRNKLWGFALSNHNPIYISQYLCFIRSSAIVSNTSDMKTFIDCDKKQK